MRKQVVNYFNYEHKALVQKAKMNRRIIKYLNARHIYDLDGLKYAFNAHNDKAISERADVYLHNQERSAESKNKAQNDKHKSSNNKNNNSNF